jgi:predicted nucleic acid-binding protein
VAFSRRIILDSGALSALAKRSRAARMFFDEALKSGAPLVVPTVVLVESLTGTSRDAQTNAILKSATIVGLDANIARSAAALRHKHRLRGAGTIDAIVVACADYVIGSIIVTSDRSLFSLPVAAVEQRGATEQLPPCSRPSRRRYKRFLRTRSRRRTRGAERKWVSPQPPVSRSTISIST